MLYHNAHVLLLLFFLVYLSFVAFGLATERVCLYLKFVFISYQVAGGWRHTVALDADGQLYGWGWNKVTNLCRNSTLSYIILLLIIEIHLLLSLLNWYHISLRHLQILA